MDGRVPPGADNYQDRYDFVARVGNDPSDLGSYLRESGTPLFKDGTITGATTGIEVGGAFAAGHFQDVDIVGPTQSGLEIVGQPLPRSTGLPSPMETTVSWSPTRPQAKWTLKTST